MKIYPEKPKGLTPIRIDGGSEEEDRREIALFGLVLGVVWVLFVVMVVVFEVL